MADAELQATPRLWRNRDYLWWLGSDTGHLLGMSLYAFLLPLIALQVLDDPAAAGTVAAAGQLPRVLLTLPGGVLSDRHDRRLLMVVAGVVGAGLVAVFLLVESLGRLDFWTLVVIAAAMGARNGLLAGVSNTALKQVVSTRQLPTALSANQARDGAVQLGAAPAGGALLMLGAPVALLASLVALLGSGLSALGIRADLHPRAGRAGPGTEGGREEPGVDSAQAEPAAAGVLAEAMAGLVWLWRQPVLRGVLFVSTLVNLGVHATLTTLIFAFQQEGVPPATIGLLTSAMGGAVIIGALLAPWLVRRVPTGRLALAAMLAVAGAFGCLAVLDSVALVILVFGAAFLLGPAIDAGLLGYFMARVPSHLMGRALNAFSLFSLGAVPLAPVLAGFGLGALGRQGTLALCAALPLLAALLVWASRDLRRLPGPDEWEDPGPDG